MTTLDRYFKKANQTPPVIRQDEILKKIQAADIAQKSFFTKNILLKTGVSAFALALVVTGGFWLHSQQSDSLKTSKSILTATHKEDRQFLRYKKYPYSAPIKTTQTNADLSDDKGKSLNIEGINVIELNESESKHLGLVADTNGVWYHRYFWQDSSLAIAEKISMTGVSFPPMKKISDHPNISIPKFEPLLITDDRGSWRMFFYSMENLSQHKEAQQKAEKKLFKSFNNLIPVLVRTGRKYTVADEQNKRYRPDCIFWYDATPEFISALPERFKKSLKIENKAVEALALKTEAAIEKVKPLPSPQAVLKELQQKENKVEVQEILIPEKEKRETGDTYFDVWRGASGAIISTQIFPNPVKNKTAAVKFSLKEARNIIITLHDIYGRRMAELSKSAAFKSGEYLQEIVLKDIQPGIYLIAIQTDKGEQAVQRVIVE